MFISIFGYLTSIFLTPRFATNVTHFGPYPAKGSAEWHSMKIGELSEQSRFPNYWAGGSAQPVLPERRRFIAREIGRRQ
ncbi:MAG: hypothetical protein JSR99_00315 [Proteobacteria bacterium]|nr:hypothetical protein [Pseudomonadota bacterium]